MSAEIPSTSPSLVIFGHTEEQRAALAQLEQHPEAISREQLLRIRDALIQVAQERAAPPKHQRLPDPPILEDMISPPFDLPRMGEPYPLKPAKQGRIWPEPYTEEE